MPLNETSPSRQGGTYPFLSSCPHPFVRSGHPILSSRPCQLQPARARKICQGRRVSAAERGLSLTDRAPRYAGARSWSVRLAFCVRLLLQSSGLVIWTGLASRSMASCDGRISLYPAAPIRLATLLHAWTYRAGRMGLIARTAEGLGPSCEAVSQSHIRPARRAQRGSVGTVYVQCVDLGAVGDTRMAPCGTSPCG